jgi:hypothetical protein
LFQPKPAVSFNPFFWFEILSIVLLGYVGQFAVEGHLSE